MVDRIPLLVCIYFIKGLFVIGYQLQWSDGLYCYQLLFLEAQERLRPLIF